MLKSIQALLIVSISLNTVFAAAGNTWLQTLKLTQPSQTGFERMASSSMTQNQQPFMSTNSFFNNNFNNQQQQRMIQSQFNHPSQFVSNNVQQQQQMVADRTLMSQESMPVMRSQDSYGQSYSFVAPQVAPVVPQQQQTPSFVQVAPQNAPVVPQQQVSVQTQRVLSACDPNPCLNEGECVLSGASFQCRCPWGWTGSRCEICLTECASNPCPANKRCKARHGGGFECVCPPERTGPNCDLVNDVCSNNPCLNNGVCNPIEGGSFTCQCPEPWAGSRCEQQFQNPCTEQTLRLTNTPQFPNPWNRKSFLVCTDVSRFETMSCPVGTYFNEHLNHCVPEGYNPPVCPTNHCQNDGECILDESNLPRCACRKGFNGERCEVDIDECALGGNQACAGGQCVDQVNGYYCRCANGLVGVNCRDAIQNPCTDQNIRNDNVFFILPSDRHDVYLHCTNEMQFTVSRCPDNLVWHSEERTCAAERAPVRSGLCAALPCKNGAECQETLSGVQCVCKTGFTGQFCETMIDFCLSNPCQNGGRCLSYAGGYTCICQDKVIDECCCHGVVNPCPPKGRVLPGINNYFPHLFPHRYIHCDFEGRAFAKVCPTTTRWSQEVMSCLPEGFVLNTTVPLQNGQVAAQPIQASQQPAPVRIQPVQVVRQEPVQAYQQPVQAYQQPAPIRQEPIEVVRQEPVQAYQQTAPIRQEQSYDNTARNVVQSVPQQQMQLTPQMMQLLQLLQQQNIKLPDMSSTMRSTENTRPLSFRYY